MIDLYSGTPGSGKSLHAAERIVMRSRFGEPVIGNFPCKLDRYKKANYTYVPNNKLTPDFLISFSKEFFKDKPVKEGAILLIIDECQLMFNSRDWQRKGREEWLSFFTLHRHLGYDIVLIAQMDRMIDRQIRGLIEYEYVHRKLNNYGWRGILLRCATLGANFISVKVWYPMKEKVSQDIFRASKRYYSIYDTYVLFDGDGVKNSEIVKKEGEKRMFLRVGSDLKLKTVILLRSFYSKMIKEISMHFTKALPGCGSLPASLRRFLRKFADFLYYDCVELLVIAIGVVVILFIWEITFWR